MSAMTKSTWTPADIPDLSGNTAIVTGANSGIGLAAARHLAAHGARVVLAVRDPGRGEDAAATIDGEREVRTLDLADLDSVRAFAAGWEGPVDLLVNNAGIMATPFGRTRDGFELQIGTNHLGHFALTNLMLDQVRGRVVTVSSNAHRMGRVDLDDLNWESRRYGRWPAYGQTKLANLLFTLELQRRLDEAGSPVRATAAHPGWSATGLQGHTGSRFHHVVMAIGNRVIAQSDERGSWPTLFAAVEDIPGGSYAGPDGIGQHRGKPRLVGRSAAARDADTARGLWELSERLTGTSFPLARVGDEASAAPA